MNSLSKTLKVVILGSLGCVVLYILCWSVRWVRNDMKGFSPKKNLIWGLWHGRQLMLGPLHGRYLSFLNLVMLISAHTDGRIIATAIRAFGIRSAAGSSTSGGTQAFRELIGHLKKGDSVGVTPDGPKGPKFKVKTGLLKLSQLTQVPIYPLTYGAQSYWKFKSWDEMILPKPFSKGVCLIGDPIVIPRSCTEEELEVIRIDLERRINEITLQADEFNYN